MKVWELEEGKEYIRYQNDNAPLKYMISEGVLNYFNPVNNAWCTSNMPYNDIKDVDLVEYTPPTDWSKVEVDTKVLVRDWDNSEWIPRHFAQYKNGRIYTWNNGHTSFTSRGEDDYVPYNQGKLHKEE